MNTSAVSVAQRAVKIAVAVACVFFLPAVGLSPAPGSSLGMPWSTFYCTWGVMLVAVCVSLFGYTGCKLRGESIGVFYAVCPALLLLAFLVQWNLNAICHWYAS
jgi:hypothetical protein